MVNGAIEGKQCDWAKAHDEHVRAEQTANALAARLEAVERDKAKQIKRLQARVRPPPMERGDASLPAVRAALLTDRLPPVQEHRLEVERYAQLYEDLKRELEVVQASASAV